MFERFTDRARHVVVLAQEEARHLEHDHIGTEHLLLGLIHEGEGVAAKVLEGLEISLEGVRSQVEERIGTGACTSPSHLPFTPRAKKVLKLAFREALQLGHKDIGTEHVLLGLIREGEGVAAQVLQTLGADLGRVRDAVTEQLAGSVAEPSPRWRRRRPIELDPGPVDEPTCPTCRRRLAEHAGTTTLTLPDGAEIAVVYCRACGRTLGTTLR